MRQVKYLLLSMALLVLSGYSISHLYSNSLPTARHIVTGDEINLSPVHKFPALLIKESLLRLGWHRGESHVSLSQIANPHSSDKELPDDIDMFHDPVFPIAQETLTNTIPKRYIRVLLLNSHAQPYIFVGNSHGNELFGQIVRHHQLHRQNLSKSRTYEIIAAADDIGMISAHPGTGYTGYLRHPEAELTVAEFRKTTANIAANLRENTGIIVIAPYQASLLQSKDLLPQYGCTESVFCRCGGKVCPTTTMIHI